MRRYAMVLVLALSVVGAGTAGEIKIAWWGQSMFEIMTPKGSRIILDPQYLDAYKPRDMTADVVLFSHFHNDHTRTECITNIKEALQFNALKKVGGGEATDHNLVDEKVGKAKEVRIQSMGTYHDSMGGLTRGKNGCWIMDIEGVRIVHLGDLGHTLSKAQLKKLGKVDVLMIPVGGVYTLNGIDAWKVVKQVNAVRHVIPMHYGTVVYDDLLPLKYFTDEVEEPWVIDRRKPKTWLVIDTEKEAPKTPSVVILDYQGSPAALPVRDKGKEKEKDKDR
jgi:L-ascorbate metabolism protein UlaG (beta-lactamase superfamily)